MLSLLHAPDPNRPLAAADPIDLESLGSTPGWWWLDATSPTDEEIASIGALLGMHALDLDDIAQPSQMPKLDERSDYLFLVAHSPALDGDRLRSVEFDCLLGDGFLVTIRGEDLPGFDVVAGLAAERPLAGPDALLALLVDVVGRRSVALVDVLDGELDELEALAVLAAPEVVERTQALRRDTIRLRRVLLPQRDVVRSLGRDDHRFVGDAARRQFASSHDDYARAVDALDTGRLLLGSVIETYRSTVAEQMGEVMKVLTIFSAILLPLGLLAGIYGMNFANLPGIETEFGYLILFAVMAAVAGGLWGYFVAKGFISGLRLPRVDRVVGRGLAAFVHVSMAPVRGARNLMLEEWRGDGHRSEAPPPAD